MDLPRTLIPPQCWRYSPRRQPSMGTLRRTRALPPALPLPHSQRPRGIHLRLPPRPPTFHRPLLSPLLPDGRPTKVATRIRHRPFPRTCFLLPGSAIVSLLITRIGHFREFMWTGWTVSTAGLGLGYVDRAHADVVLGACLRCVWPRHGNGVEQRQFRNAGERQGERCRESGSYVRVHAQLGHGCWCCC